ncbi:Predicted acetyltransferase [Oceanobacillus limi]|uniref:Predicted acetyltransferase n=1 Tax=Oceanobacillus limi TaxID=930131 RepID=A0A1I0GKH0_9BACI|nr:GNAT family N-acetyltransferase [Oceanobacillus limi]SET71532.1 Predicted acetyltransferase [Oceanobacillus limi]
MDITVTTIPYEDRSILSNLIQLYRYDSSEFDDHVVNRHGLYPYKYLDHQWTDDYRRPFIVKVDGEIAGFVLLILDVPNEFTKLSSAEKTIVISDFFMMRKYRRKGIGKQVAFLLFQQFAGSFWEVKQTISNKPAYEFWNRIIREYTGSNYTEVVIQNESWNGPIFVFQS